MIKPRDVSNIKLLNKINECERGGGVDNWKLM